MANNKYDVTIIGSGIGGLMCGAKLAKKGVKVLIIEKHIRPGGCVTSCRKNGFNFDYGAHIFGSCNKNGILRYYLDELKIDIDFIRINPTERFIFPDQVIEVPQDIDKYAALLKSSYSLEAENIDPFFKEVVKIARSFSSDKLLAKYSGMTFEDLLKKYFKDEKLMSVLSAEFRYMGSTPKVLAATSMCLMMVSYLRDGAYYPRGGSQVFSNALADRFKQYGGTLLLGSEVTDILIKNKKIYGVKTADKNVYLSDAVVSNGDAIRTMTQLVDSHEIGSTYLKKLKNLRIGPSFFMIFLGVKDSPVLKDKSGWYHFSYGLDLEPAQSLYIFMPSFLDDSLAPKGRHVLDVAMPFPYAYGDITDWDLCKNEMRNRVMNIVNMIIPGVSNLIEFEESATPKTIQRYTYNSHGSICGWAMDSDQVQAGRLAYETPVESLYLTGQWTNPGCGVVSAATSGWIIADRILSKRGSNKAILAS